MISTLVHTLSTKDTSCAILINVPLPVSRAQIEPAMVYSSAASVKRLANTPDIKQAYICLY